MEGIGVDFVHDAKVTMLGETTWRLEEGGREEGGGWVKEGGCAEGHPRRGTRHGGAIEWVV